MDNQALAQCRLCESFSVINLLELNNMPSQAQYFPINSIDASLMKTNFDIGQCIDCGLVQILGEPVSYYKEVVRSNKVSGALRKFRLNQLDTFIKKYRLENRLLIEVGCGDGDVLDLIRELQFDSHGIEYREEFVNRLRNEGFTVHKGYVADSQFSIPNMKYDAFLSFNVLEHSPNPKTFLKGMRALLKPEAIGLIEVPNLDMILSKNMLSEFMLEHLCYFTRETLRLTLESSGFQVLGIENVWHDYLISATVKNRPTLSFEQEKISWDTLKNEMHVLLSSYSKNKICVWSAGHQSLATLSMLEIEDRIQFIVDNSLSKQGKYAPGSGIPIVAPEILRKSEEISCVIVLGGSYTQEIVDVLRGTFSKKLKIITLLSTKIHIS